MANKDKSYDLSKVPPRFRAQCGADILAANKHAKTPEAREAYISGMIRAYSVVNDEPPRRVVITVEGGVAEDTEVPEGINVIIRDLDNIEAGDPDPLEGEES